MSAARTHQHAAPTGTRMRPTALRAGAQQMAAAVILGLVLEAGPMLLGSVVGPPYAWALAPLGFVLAWAAIVASRRAGGQLDPAGGLRSLPPLLGRLLMAYGLAILVTVGFLVATSVAVGLWLHGTLAGFIVEAATISLVSQFAYVVPCIVDGDDLVVSLERAWLLAHAKGLSGEVIIVALVIAALGPPVAVAELSSSLAPPAALLATLATLALTGPLLAFGLERLRPSLEAAVRREDPFYGRP